MKHVFRNSYEVCHVFAQQTQDEGHCSNVSFRDNLLYSYALPIANVIDREKQIALITDNKYSVTTAKHIREVSSALSHYKRLYVWNVDVMKGHYTELNKRKHIGNIKYMIEELKAIEKKQKTSRIHDYTGSYSCITSNFKAYVNIFHIKTILTREQREYYNGKALMVDTENLERNQVIQEALNDKWYVVIQEAHRLQSELCNKQREEEKRILALTLPEKIAAFRNGELWTLPYQVECAYLRLSPDKSRIETSKGSQVLVAHARILWNMIVHAMKTGKEYIPQTEIKVDYYTLTKITVDGTVIIGCHNIPFEESAAIARELGWI